MTHPEFINHVKLFLVYVCVSTSAGFKVDIVFALLDCEAAFGFTVTRLMVQLAGGKY